MARRRPKTKGNLKLEIDVDPQSFCEHWSFRGELKRASPESRIPGLRHLVHPE